MSIDNRHGFLNISITPLECSVVCHSSWARNVFEPSIRRLPRDAAGRVTVSKDTYLVLSVISAGLDAGSRVMELTSPLAMSGVPIFFITTYYSDYILVPSKDRKTVVQALRARGFEFSEDMSAFVSPTAMSRSRGGSWPQSGTGDPAPPPPSTPPPSTVAELQRRTFELLKKRNVTPYVEPGLSLVQCAGRDQSQFIDNIGRHHHHQRQQRSRGSCAGGDSDDHGYFSTSRKNSLGNGNGNRNGGSNWLDEVDAKLYASLISALATQPRFLSVTIARGEDAPSPSLLMDRTLLPAFGGGDSTLLVGDTDGDLVPVFLDLEGLPLEATGIVSGVAGKLVEEMGNYPSTGGSGGGNNFNSNMVEGVAAAGGLGLGGVAGELSYLSTARAGAVILPREQSVRALEVLRPLLVKDR